MPVTLIMANHVARKWTVSKSTTADKFLERACPKEHRRSTGIIQSSFSKQTLQENHISPFTHGFVRAIFHAYSSHHHLTLRPEDVLFSILSQLSFFINAHAEELRSLFVAHEGQKELDIKKDGNIHTVDLGKLAVRMTDMIEQNVVDPEIVDFWRKCAHETGGSGPQYLCGWITAFCFWSEMGDSLYREIIDTSEEPEEFGLDKVLSHRVETDDIPSAFTSVPVTVNDNGVVHETKMVAGMVGIQATSSGQPMDRAHGYEYGPDGKRVPAGPVDKPGLGSIQPVSGWWMYETENSEVKQARQKEKQAIIDELKKLKYADNSYEARKRDYQLRRKLEDLS